ncbi:hypothetical protein [Nocardia miyunensis]|uniref:hypothetical protein n=1 Tax=Nocardia miyunensis TaxID=282684 RepID=UPI00082E1E93|nr:hypothetical protein [Nocardia miyunensis]
MAEPKNVVDLVTANVLEKLAEHIEDATRTVQAAAEKQISESLAALTPVPMSANADARDRAQRTAIQGAVATVVVAVLLAVAGVIGGSGFDITNAGDWKAVGGAALGAVVTVVAAYVHRLVAPPQELPPPTDAG